MDLVLAPDGVRHAPTGLHVDFGRAETGAIVAVSRILGAEPGDRVAVAGCGVVVRWSAGLDLVFRDETFVGWQAEADRFTATGDLPPGAQSAGVVCARA
jgi:hypothetical protein